MASNQRTIRNYARSIFLAAGKTDDIRNIHKRMNIIDQLHKSIPELRLLLHSRRIDTPTKMTIISKVLKNIATPFEMEFFHVLIENKEVRHFSQIIAQFSALVEKESDSVKVTVSTADKISEQSLSEIMAAVKKSVGKQVEYHTNIDPGLIGGMTLRIGNTIVDGSVRKRLEKLKMSLLRA